MLKSHLTPKIESTLKGSKYDSKPWVLHGTGQKRTNVHAVLERYSEFLHTCLMCPCRSLYECFFYSDGNVGQILPQNTRRQVAGENKYINETHSKGLGRVHYTRAKLQGLSLKRLGHWTLKEFGGVRSNQPVEVFGIAPLPATREGRPSHPLSASRLSRPCITSTRSNSLAGGSCVLWLCTSTPCAGYMGGGYADPGMKTPSISIQIY